MPITRPGDPAPNPKFRWVPVIVIAAFLVKEMPLDLLRWLVVAVVAYAGITLLRAAMRTGEPATAAVGV